MEGTDRSECVPVIPGGECLNCHWSIANPYVNGTAEPHPVMPHGTPGVNVTGKCANCGAMLNLDAVKCDKCGFEPVSPEMYDALKTVKDKYRRVQGLKLLPVRGEPIKNTADVKPAPKFWEQAEVSMSSEQQAAVDKARAKMEAEKKAAPEPPVIG